MNHDLNLRLTQVAAGTPGGQLQRRFWQPVALVEEFDPQLAPDMGTPIHPRLIKTVRALGQDLVLVKNHDGTWALLDRDCPHRGASLAFARYESADTISSQIDSKHAPNHAGDQSVSMQKSGSTLIRCPFHGWAFQTSGTQPGQCVDTPAEPIGSRLCEQIKLRSYPTLEKAGVVWAWLGDEPPAAFPELDCFAAPPSHSFAFKGLWHANWLQCFEVGMDPAHPSFLHRFLYDSDLQETGNNAGGKQFRSASAGNVDGQRWPMSRVMRELHRPKIHAQSVRGHTWQGIRIAALRELSEKSMHVRVTHAIFPHVFVIPLSETMTITQWHLPVDDRHTYWYSVFTSYGEPIDHQAMRAQRLAYTTLPHYIPKAGAHNNWGFNPVEQQTRTFLGMGEDDINVHDQWAVESMGSLQDRTREHLGTSDKVIALYRRWLQSAIAATEKNEPLPELPATQTQSDAPSTVDGFAAAENWQAWWLQMADEKRKKAQWL